MSTRPNTRGVASKRRRNRNPEREQNNYGMFNTLHNYMKRIP